MSVVLITGVAGFIGSHLAEALLSADYKVIGLDNFDPFYARSIKENNLSGFIDHPNFRFFEMDIRESSSFKQLPTNIDTVIHLAAKAGVRPSIDDPESYLSTNILGSQNIMQWMASNGIGKILFASSSSVYGNNKKIPFSEQDNVDHPISPYAYTKKAGELLMHTFHHLYNISVLCLRFFTVYGPRQRPDLAIHKFANLIENDQPITMFGDGSSARDYTFVGDTVSGISALLKHLEKTSSPMFDIINLGNNHPVELKDMIDSIFTAAGKSVPVIKTGMQPGDVDITYADISKAYDLVGYKPSTSFQAGLEAFFNWKNNG